MDCTDSTVTCMHYVEDPDAAYYDGYGEWTPVDAGECPTTQDAAGEQAAHQYGYYGMNDGVNASNGLQACTSKVDPSDSTSVYIAYASCVYNADQSAGTTKVDCNRYRAPNPYTAGAGYTTMQPDVPDEWCAQQDSSTTAYGDISKNFSGLVAPAKVLETQGSNCADYSGGHTIHGLTCGDATTGQGCTAITYKTDYNGAYTITSTVPGVAADCAADEGLNASQKRFLADSGFFPAGPDGQAMCTAPDVYGATGECKNTVTYDNGWPQQGSAHVNYGFDAHCYGVYGSADPTTAVAQEVPIADCQAQQTTPEQKALLETLKPALQDYASMDQTCDGSAGVNIQYDRASQSAITNDPSQIIDGDAPSGTVVYEVAKFPYACTDVPNYFDGTYEGAQTYDMDRYPCNTAHDSDTNNQMLGGRFKLDNEQSNDIVGSGGTITTTTAEKAYDVAIACDQYFGNDSPVCAWNNGNPPHLIRVIDHKSEQYYEVIFKFFVKPL